MHQTRDSSCAHKCPSWSSLRKTSCYLSSDASYPTGVCIYNRPSVFIAARATPRREKHACPRIKTEEIIRAGFPPYQINYTYIYVVRRSQRLDRPFFNFDSLHPHLLVGFDENVAVFAGRFGTRTEKQTQLYFQFD